MLVKLLEGSEKYSFSEEPFVLHLFARVQVSIVIIKPQKLRK